MENTKGTILMKKDDKLLLLYENKYYIIKGEGEPGDVIDFDTEDALQMPSYMFAIAAMEEENLDNTLDFIQNKWFSKNNREKD